MNSSWHVEINQELWFQRLFRNKKSKLPYWSLVTLLKYNKYFVKITLKCNLFFKFQNNPLRKGINLNGHIRNMCGFMHRVYYSDGQKSNLVLLHFHLILNHTSIYVHLHSWYVYLIEHGMQPVNPWQFWVQFFVFVNFSFSCNIFSFKIIYKVAYIGTAEIL